MVCFICGENNWHSLKELNKEKELQVCNTCGNVCYLVDAAQEEKMRDFYRYDYRQVPNHLNLITTTHKQHYAECFLKDFLKDKQNLTIGDVGCATGYLVNYFRKLGHKATGCEYTITYRRFAEHFYNIPVTEELRDEAYDFITIYHVLEHMIEPDKKLAQYASMLKEDGHLLISTPEWYNVLQEASGPPIISFENLWHKNHINVFSEQSLKNLFRKCKLSIVKEDHLVYGQTYLLRKMTQDEISQGLDKIIPEDPKVQIEKTHQGKKAIDHFLKKEYKEAISIWPKFPDAWINHTFETYGKDPVKQADMFTEAFKIMPLNRKINFVYATVYLYQQGQYEACLNALKWFEENAPDENTFYIAGLCHAMLGHHKDAMRYFYITAEMNPTKWVGCMDGIGKEASQLLTWDERALEKISDSVKKEARPKLKLHDPVFDGNGIEKEEETKKLPA